MPHGRRPRQPVPPHVVQLAHCTHAPERRIRSNAGRTDEWFAAEVVIDGQAFDAQVHALQFTPKGKWYASLEVNTRAAAEARTTHAGGTDCWYQPCPVCAERLAVPLWDVLRPALHAAGFPVVATSATQTWWVFSFEVPPAGAMHRTGRSRQPGPEVVVVEFAQPLACPLHGAVTLYEDEPVD